MLIGDFLRDIGVAPVLWLLDSPVSNSGRLKTLIGQVAAENAWDWDVRLTTSPDTELKKTHMVVASADGIVLDECRQWVNLGAEIVTQRLPATAVIDLSHGAV
jgi:hypothetical protein